MQALNIKMYVMLKSDIIYVIVYIIFIYILFRFLSNELDIISNIKSFNEYLKEKLKYYNRISGKQLIKKAKKKSIMIAIFKKKLV